MRRNSFCLAVVAATVCLGLGVLVVAQETETPGPVASAWSITGGAVLFFPAMEDLNQQIDFFNQDIIEIARALKTLYGTSMGIDFFNQDIIEVARALKTLYDTSMGIDGWLSPLTAGAGWFGQLLYKPFPFMGVGLEVEYLPVYHHEASAIYSTPDKKVAFAVEISVPAAGMLGVLCFDSTDLVDLGLWSFQLLAGLGYYNATAKMEKQIQLTGIDEFTLSDEADVTVGTSALGSKLSFAVEHRFAPDLLLKLSVTSRGLTFRQVRINFNDLTDGIDLDFSGMCLSAGLGLRF